MKQFSAKLIRNMQKLRIFFVISIILVVSISITHVFAFPQESNCILIDFYDFEETENIYFRSNVKSEKIEHLAALIDVAEHRVEKFWGTMSVKPKFIYCDNEEDYQKFGSKYPSPACAHMKMGAYVVISNDGINIDILAHEISHTELYQRIGFFNRTLKIPTWFDEGLAMQVDLREQYSADSLTKMTEDLTNIPDIMSLQTYAQFGNGTQENVILNYALAKYVLEKWHTPEKLMTFIDKMNNGDDFESCYNHSLITIKN